MARTSGKEGRKEGEKGEREWRRSKRKEGIDEGKARRYREMVGVTRGEGD